MQQETNIGFIFQVIRIGAILGLGLAYSGSNREAVLNVLTPVLSDEKSSLEVVGITALACGMIAVGTTNQLVVEALVTTLLAKSETELKDTYARFISLGLALAYLGEWIFVSNFYWILFFHFSVEFSFIIVLPVKKNYICLLRLPRQVWGGPLLHRKPTCPLPSDDSHPDWSLCLCWNW